MNKLFGITTSTNAKSAVISFDYDTERASTKIYISWSRNEFNDGWIVLINDLQYNIGLVKSNPVRHPHTVSLGDNDSVVYDVKRRFDGFKYSLKITHHFSIFDENVGMMSISVLQGDE